MLLYSFIVKQYCRLRFPFSLRYHLIIFGIFTGFCNIDEYAHDVPDSDEKYCMYSFIILFLTTEKIKLILHV